MTDRLVQRVLTGIELDLLDPQAPERLEGDSDIHIVLFGDNTYVIAEMPAPHCIPKKGRDRKAMIAVRKKFEATCGKLTNHWQPLGAIVQISGVGFCVPSPHRRSSQAAERG